MNFIKILILPFLLLATACDNMPPSNQAEATLTAPSSEQSNEETFGFYERTFKGNCQHQNPSSQLGKGIIVAPSKFYLYSDAALSKVLFEIDVAFADEITQLVCPKFFDPAYGVLHFIWLESTAKAHKILLNATDFGYIDKNINVKTFLWNEYALKSLVKVEATEQDENGKFELRVFKEPNEDAEILKLEVVYPIFCVLDVKGNWLKINVLCEHQQILPHDLLADVCAEATHCNSNKQVWVQWRDKSELLLEFFFENNF